MDGRGQQAMSDTQEYRVTVQSNIHFAAVVAHLGCIAVAMRQNHHTESSTVTMDWAYFRPEHGKVG
ncbi:hypothetical protein VSP9026_03732 [Vibrio spartinae]|uniref:Uncharacterized protein n=1 Tax=Vibrio spartinae TaxID=1918945 RepID=A0A1N6M976_9VIBR|nr:hypothetical protein VSP9026_03732 [Vibrio spartinae]